MSLKPFIAKTGKGIYASLLAIGLSFCGLTVTVSSAMAQAGRSVPGVTKRNLVVPVFVRFTEDKNKPKPLLSAEKKDETDRVLTRDKVDLFDAGIQQKIESFSPDPSPARIVVLLDNSSTLQSDVRKLASVPAAFAPEIYEGDKVMVIGYDQKPETVTEFTDKPEVLQNTLSLLRKTDSPHLFDALDVVMEDVLRPVVGFSKRVIVLVSDGLDRDSKARWERVLATLQDENITVYAIQIKDRTRGALRRDGPKPAEVLEQITTATGGRLYSIDGDIKSAVKEICDELKNDRYLLTYSPEGVNPVLKRNLLLSSSDATISLRLKGYHPAHQF